MASPTDNISMAVFCDFENVALGVRDANYEKFDIKPVLERLLLKGSIVVKKAYCDWERYKGFKATMHEANFELIEIPHVRQSGKNSADIRLVVDALDLCYTKSHVNTFVIISGDSDFSPLVSKLRENAKQVIGVGVKQSTSDLLVANCDEFIFYDDLVREVRRAAAKRDERKTQPPAKRSPDEGNRRKEELEARKTQAIELVVEMFDALVSERGDSGKIWASLLKDTLKRRRPDFNETYYGFRTFGNLLEEAQARGMLEFGRDEKSGAYVYRSSQAQNASPVLDLAQPMDDNFTAEVQEQAPAKSDSRRGRGRGGRKPDQSEVVEAEFHEQERTVQPDDKQPDDKQPDEEQANDKQSDGEPPDGGRQDEGRKPVRQQQARQQRNERQNYRQHQEPVMQTEPELEVDPVRQEAAEAVVEQPEKRRASRGARKPAARKAAAPIEISAAPVEKVEVAQAAPESGTANKPPRKPAARSRRPAKPKAAPDIA